MNDERYVSTAPVWLADDPACLDAPHVLVMARVQAHAQDRPDLLESRVLDQAEAALYGGWGGGTDVDAWGRMALARCVAKSIGTDQETVVRDAVCRAGVTDWFAFVAHVVAPLGLSYGATVATFGGKDAYRWVRVADLPAPTGVDAHKMTADLAASWEHLSKRRRFSLRAPTTVEVRDRWVAANRLSADGWLLANVPWGDVMAVVRDIWDAPVSQWTHAGIDRTVDGLDDRVVHGVRSVLMDPIVWSPDTGRLSNGRHRVLALLLAEVDEVLVYTR